MLKFLLCNDNTESEKRTNFARVSPNIDQEERKQMMQPAPLLGAVHPLAHGQRARRLACHGGFTANEDTGVGDDVAGGAGCRQSSGQGRCKG